MVGYVYSLHPTLGYNYILIEVYSAESLYCIDKPEPCNSYVVNRSDGTFTYEKEFSTAHKLSLRQIRSIASVINQTEADDDYPKKISWEIIPGGEVNFRDKEDIIDTWYAPTEMLDTNMDYINISDICFKGQISNLELSFAVHVLKQSCHACGIYANDTFTACGDKIFCSTYMALYEKSLFGTVLLYNRFKERLSKPDRLGRIRKTDILKLADKLLDIPTQSHEGVLAYISEIERRTGVETARIFKHAVLSSRSPRWLCRRIMVCMHKSYLSLLSMTDEFKKRTGCSSADMKYLSISELHEIFVSSDKAMNVRALIKKKRRRRAYLENMSVPMILHKGKFY